MKNEKREGAILAIELMGSLGFCSAETQTASVFSGPRESLVVTRYLLETRPLIHTKLQ